MVTIARRVLPRPLGNEIQNTLAYVAIVCCYCPNGELDLAISKTHDKQEKHLISYMASIILLRIILM